MTKERSNAQAQPHLLVGAGKPRAHAVVKERPGLRLVNGRIIGRTLADPDMREKVNAISKRAFPNKEAFVKEMNRRGVLTPTGKLSKKYGG